MLHYWVRLIPKVVPRAASSFSATFPIPGMSLQDMSTEQAEEVRNTNERKQRQNATGAHRQRKIRTALTEQVVFADTA